jgi:histone deacetylase 1/2
VKFDSIKTILFVTTTEDMDITQFDVRTTFLYGEIGEEIFLEQPLGFVDDENPTEVCRLVEALYRLK